MEPAAPPAANQATTASADFFVVPPVRQTYATGFGARAVPKIGPEDGEAAEAAEAKAESLGEELAKMKQRLAAHRRVRRRGRHWRPRRSGPSPCHCRHHNRARAPSTPVWLQWNPCQPATALRP